MSQSLELYRGLRDESLWTPDIVYDVAPPNTLVRDGYDYGEGTDGYDQEATRGSLIDGVVDFFSKLFGGLEDIFGGSSAGGGFLNHVATGVINLVQGVAGALRRAFGGETTEWEEDPNHVFAPVTESLEEAVFPILEKAEEGVERAGEANQRIIDLGAEVEAKVGEQGEITQRIEGINAEMARQFAEDGLLQQEFDAVRSDLSAATSDLSDDIERLEKATGEDVDRLAKVTGEDYEALNTKLWGNQGELNRINDELWGSQSTLNTTLSDFRKMQLAWNDNTTGWIKKQEDIQNLNDEFRDEQAKINEEITDILDLLKAAQEKQVDTSFRTLTPYMNGGEDEYVRILPSGGVQAKGSWVGHIIYTTAPRPVSRETGKPSFAESHVHTYTDSVCETYSNTVPSQGGTRTYATERVSVVQYLPSPGTQQSETVSRVAFTPGTSWTKLLGFKVNSPGDHIVKAEIKWAAADKGSKYGMEIGVMRAGNWRRVKLWESNQFGPTFPWQDGRRTSTTLTSFDISEAEAASGAEIQLRAYSSGDSSQRRTTSSSMEITYIKQPTE